MNGLQTIHRLNRENAEAHAIMKKSGYDLPAMPKGQPGTVQHFSLAELAAQREAAERVAKAVETRA